MTVDFKTSFEDMDDFDFPQLNRSLYMIEQDRVIDAYFAEAATLRHRIEAVEAGNARLLAEFADMRESLSREIEKWFQEIAPNEATIPATSEGSK
jgi:hypothetical protein